MSKTAKIWLFGIAAVLALVLALVRMRSSTSQVEVQFVDSTTRTPLTNITVTVMKTYRTPIISSLKFCPDSLKWRHSSVTLIPNNGRMKIERVTGRSTLDYQTIQVDRTGRLQNSNALSGQKVRVPDFYCRDGQIFGKTKVSFLSQLAVSVDYAPISIPARGPVLLPVDLSQ